MPFSSRPRFRHHLAPGSIALCALLAAGCSVSNQSVGTAKKAGGDLKVPSLGQWFSEAWQRYNAKPAPRARVVPSPRVFDNRNATQPTLHPAWQLANDLGSDAPLNFDIPAAKIFQIAALQSGSVRIGDVSALRPLRGNTNSNNNFVATDNISADARALQRWQLSALDARTAYAQNLLALQNQIETRQLSAVDTLLVQSLNAQNKARTNIARSLEAALQDDIALARQLNPGALEPYLPSELQALALSNLRLDLLPALDKTPAQERDSNEERVRRDIAIRAALREQELARRGALKRLREDLPVQLEAAKREELQKTLSAQSERDQQLREKAQAEARALIAQDFTAADARLGIVLPAQSQATVVASLANSTSDVERPISNLKRTRNGNGTSFGAGEIKLSSSNANPVRPTQKTNFDLAVIPSGQARGRAQQSDILKTLARHDARQWARISARRDRAWQAKPTATPTKSERKSETPPTKKAAQP